MPLTRKPKSSRHRINIHRGYSVDEVARARGVTKGTVRRWTKSGLPAITDQKPLLILGEDLIEFLTMRKAPSQRCSLSNAIASSAGRRGSLPGIWLNTFPSRLTPEIFALFARCAFALCTSGFDATRWSLFERF